MIADTLKELEKLIGKLYKLDESLDRSTIDWLDKDLNMILNAVKEVKDELKRFKGLKVDFNDD